MCLRSWYERNKHIFPASRWEPYDPTKNWEKYTVSVWVSLCGHVRVLSLIVCVCYVCCVLWILYSTRSQLQNKYGHSVATTIELVCSCGIRLPLIQLVCTKFATCTNIYLKNHCCECSIFRCCEPGTVCLLCIHVFVCIVCVYMNMACLMHI